MYKHVYIWLLTYQIPPYSTFTTSKTLCTFPYLFIFLYVGGGHTQWCTPGFALRNLLLLMVLEEQMECWVRGESNLVLMHARQAYFLLYYLSSPITLYFSIDKTLQLCVLMFERFSPAYKENDNSRFFL